MSKCKLLTVIGARPQIIKASAISRAINHQFRDKAEEFILHTGQHYDSNMSQVFFDELGIPKPNYNLGVGSGRHGEQTAKMMVGIENILLSEHYDGIVLYGDTNSTLAGALAASKLHVPIFHIEAGLRSYDLSIPEEINRIVSDQMASISFVPTENARRNMELEGFDKLNVVFNNGKSRMVCNCGDVMYDNSMFFASMAETKSDVIERYGLEKDNYILSTIHRDNNTDNKDRLSQIFEALIEVSERDGIDVCLPLHPRTKKLLEMNVDRDIYGKLRASSHMKIVPPVSFFDMIRLEKNAKIIMTDSGGVQKESFFFGKPCVIFLKDTPWKEVIESGAGVAVDADKNHITSAYMKMVNQPVEFPHLFGDGRAAEKIVEQIVDYLK